MALAPISAAELEQRVRERADMVNSEFVTSAEVRRYLEAAWQEFYSILVASGEDLFIRRAMLTPNAGDMLGTENLDFISTEDGDLIAIGNAGSLRTYVNLPTSFKALRMVRHVDGFQLRKATLGDYEGLQNTNRPGKPLYYRLELDPRNDYVRLELLPTMDESYQLEVFYVPQVSLDEFLSTSDVGRIVRGWDEYLVLTAAGKCLSKEESDVGNLMKERELLIERIKGDLIPVDRAEPDQVQQIQHNGIHRSIEGILFGDEEMFS